MANEPNLEAAIDSLGESAPRIKAERDELRRVLKFTADALEYLWRGADQTDPLTGKAKRSLDSARATLAKIEA